MSLWVDCGGTRKVAVGFELLGMDESRERQTLGRNEGHPKKVHATLNTRRKAVKEKIVKKKKKKKPTDLAMRKQPVIWGLFLALFLGTRVFMNYTSHSGN